MFFCGLTPGPVTCPTGRRPQSNLRLKRPRRAPKPGLLYGGVRPSRTRCTGDGQRSGCCRSNSTCEARTPARPATEAWTEAALLWPLWPATEAEAVWPWHATEAALLWPATEAALAALAAMVGPATEAALAALLWPATEALAALLGPATAEASNSFSSTRSSLGSAMPTMYSKAATKQQATTPWREREADVQLRTALTLCLSRPATWSCTPALHLGF